MRPGDLMLIRGTAALSLAIMRATGGRFSHVGIVVCSMGPDYPQNGIVIEALSRVRTRQFAISTSEASYWEIWSHKFLTMEQRWTIVSTACDYSANDYGWGNILEQGLDSVFNTDLFTDKGPQLTGRPICSELATIAYNSVGLKLGPEDARSIAPSHQPPRIGIAEYVSHSPDWDCMSVKDTDGQAGS